MFNFYATSTLIVEGLYLSPATERFNPHNANVTIYKRFTGSIQWFAYQTQPDII